MHQGQICPAADLFLQGWCFHTLNEPQLLPGQLAELDALTMEVETSRLKKMGVLLLPETVETTQSVCPRYVILWGDKVIDGKRS